MAALDKFARLAALRPAHSPTALRDDQPSPEESPSAGLDECTLAKLLGATIVRTRYGNHLSVRNWYATPEFPEFRPAALDLLCRTPDAARTKKWRAAAEDPEKWLFLDSETTGLAGGTGTYAFLIGIAWWDSGGLQLEQFMMRDFSEEHSALLDLAARIAELPVLVTFNGRTFDWPLLESRYLMTRCIRVPELAAHLDLLHPARALWKLRLGSVRLVELERHVLDAPRLGWHRENDVSSALIPQFYFDYLRGGPAEPLAGVVRHNQMDLRGLAALFGKMNGLLSEQADGVMEIESLDLFGLSRFLQRRGQNDRAHSACAQALEIGLPAEFRPKARHELAQMAKRRGEHARAAEIWLEIVADANDGIHACEQLAIYYERHYKDFYRAAEFAQLAVAKLRRQRNSSRDPNFTARCVRLEQKFLHRLARLQHQMRTFGGSAGPHALSRSGGES